MTGPEHYRAAEKLLSRASFMDSRGVPSDGEAARNLTALAQVHATLAHAAATAQMTATGDAPTDEDVHAWQYVAGEPRPSATDDDL